MFSSSKVSQQPPAPLPSRGSTLHFELRPDSGHGPSDDLVVTISPGGGIPTGIVLPIGAIGPVLSETWTSSREIEAVSEGSIVAWKSAGHIVGVARGAGDGDLRATTRDLYQQIVELTRRERCPNLVRMWNYFPRINEVESIERYQQFCIGRFEAFESGGFDMRRDLPAGSAVGSHHGDQVVVFVASQQRPRFVENPRQMSAFLYPERYGPRSPSFARAALLPDQRTLLVSGTASIVGHETVHRDNLSEQVEETLRNLDAVIGQAFGPDVHLGSDELDVYLRVYVRHLPDQPAILRRLEAIVPPERMVFLHADICRNDLLVEIETVVRREPAP